MRIRYDAEISEGNDVKLVALDEKEGLKWIEAKLGRPCSSFFTVDTTCTTIPSGTPIFNKDYEVIGIVIRTSPVGMFRIKST